MEGVTSVDYVEGSKNFISVDVVLWNKKSVGSIVCIHLYSFLLCQRNFKIFITDK